MAILGYQRAHSQCGKAGAVTAGVRDEPAQQGIVEKKNGLKCLTENSSIPEKINVFSLNRFST